MADQYDLFGGAPPAQKHSTTSLAAAARIKRHIGPLHARLIAYLRERDGATDEEMQAEIPMPANTQRPRRRELQLMGLVTDSGAMRSTHARRGAVVWKLAPPPPR